MYESKIGSINSDKSRGNINRAALGCTTMDWNIFWRCSLFCFLSIAMGLLTVWCLLCYGDVPGKTVIVPSHVPSQILTGCLDLARPMEKFWTCPVFLLSRENEETSVLLSQKVALSHPVGNPNMNNLWKGQYMRKGKCSFINYCNPM